MNALTGAAAALAFVVAAAQADHDAGRCACGHHELQHRWKRGDKHPSGERGGCDTASGPRGIPCPCPGFSAASSEGRTDG